MLEISPYCIPRTFSTGLECLLFTHTSIIEEISIPWQYSGWCFTWKTEKQGFTILELLLAIFIFGVVVSVVYGSYSATFRVVNSTEKRMATATKAQTVLVRISEDLASLVQGDGRLFTGEQDGDEGARADSLSFITAAHIGLTKRDNLAGYAVINYSAEEDEDSGLLQLYRSDMPLLPGGEENDVEAVKYLLCDGLKEVKFAYFDDDAVESEEWQSGETEFAGGQQSYPVMVKIVLQFAESIESDQGPLFTTSVALPVYDG